ncbi:rCG63435 [Rattus norvegicus]|uniref:RCG63435 n=1 Tax=Rattus norvegicus TaxID=10116 RepID=A6HTV3_RAT|nr:rCG63435 [Rattus norvegicus]
MILFRPVWLEPCKSCTHQRAIQLFPLCGLWIFAKLQAPVSFLGGTGRNTKEPHSFVSGWGNLAVWV